MKKMEVKNKIQGFVLGFVVSLLVVAIGFIILTQWNKGEGTKAVSHHYQEKINANDVESVKNLTQSFFDNFKEGVPMNKNVYTDVTYQYFNKDFLENTFPTVQNELFGIYGFEELTHSFTNANGLVEEGGIKTFQIIDTETDNVHQTITVYVRMDTTLGQNTVHWMEWRNVPNEGWKINSMSFNGNIKTLSPVSPKKSF